MAMQRMESMARFKLTGPDAHALWRSGWGVVTFVASRREIIHVALVEYDAGTSHGG